jgi:hypothetical protein
LQALGPLQYLTGLFQLPGNDSTITIHFAAGLAQIGLFTDLIKQLIIRPSYNRLFLFGISGRLRCNSWCRLGILQVSGYRVKHLQLYERYINQVHVEVFTNDSNQKNLV